MQPSEVAFIAGAVVLALAIKDFLGARLQGVTLARTPPDDGKKSAVAPCLSADDEVPDAFLCAITLEVMADPVVASDGDSYERGAISRWFEAKRTSPRTRAPLECIRLVPNNALRAQIAEWREQRGLPRMPPRWVAPPAAPQQPQRAVQTSALHLSAENAADVAQAFAGVLIRAPDLRARLGLQGAPPAALLRVALSRPAAVRAVAQHADQVPELELFASTLHRLYAQQQRTMQHAMRAHAHAAPAAAAAAAIAAFSAPTPRVEARASQLRLVRALRADDAAALDEALEIVAHRTQRTVRNVIAEDHLAGDTLLHLAAWLGADACADHLIEAHGADASVRALRDGATPLHLAAARGSERGVALLLRRGADARAVAVAARPDAAAERAAVSAAAASTGPDDPLVTVVGGELPQRPVGAVATTALHFVAASLLPGRHRETIRDLVAAGASPFARDELGLTSLHFAAAGLRVEAAAALLECCGDADDCDFEDEHDESAATGPGGGARRSLADRADFVERFTALHHVAAPRAPLHHTASPAAHGPPTIAAADAPRLTAALVDLLVLHGARLDRRSRRGDTALHVAAQRSNVAAVMAFCRHGAAVDATNYEGATALHCAAATGCAGSVNALLAAGANVCARATSQDRATPLHCAVRRQRPDTVRAILDHLAAAGAGRARETLDAKALDGSTPLHCAAVTGDRPVVEALLDAGASMELRSADGDTPVHVAAWANSLGALDALLLRGACPNARKVDGSSALHLCAGRGLRAAATRLLDAGADPNRPNVAGLLPRDKAALLHDDRLVALLDQHGRDRAADAD